MDSKRILIVEDEVIVARNIERMLTNAGYVVIAIEQNGTDAIRIAREQNPDIILMDIKLEGELDGVDAGLQILDELFIPVIYITAHADENTIKRATKTQPFGYLYKPIYRNELITAIEVAFFKHESEKRVRESEARFRGLVENSPTGILFVDTDGTILDVNQKLLEIIGSPSIEATRKINFFAFPPLVDSGAARAFQQCIEEGCSSTHEHPYTSKWGKTSHLRYHLNPVMDSNGEVIGVQANIEDISDRVDAERAMKEEREKFQTIFETAKDMITLVDTRGTILDVNSRIEDLLGYSREDVIGKNFMKAGIITPTQIPALGKLFFESIRNGSADGVRELDLHHIDGTLVSMEIGTRFIKKGGSIIGVVNVFRDITERKRQLETQQRSIENRELLSTASMSLLSISPDTNIYDHISSTIQSIAGNCIVATCSVNRETDTFRINSVVGMKRLMDSVINLIGQSPIGMEVSVSDEIRSLMLRSKLTQARGDLHEQTAGGIGKTVARSIKRVLRLGETYVMGLVDQGELFGSIGIVMYKGATLQNQEIITAFINQAAIAIKRFEAEEALKRSEENFRTLTALSPVGIYATDANGRCLYVNQRWTEISGMSREKALGDGWMNGVHPDDRDWISLEWKSLVKKGETWGQEYRFLSEDGVTTWVYGLASPLKDEQGQITGFIGINLNITKRKHTEEMLRESEDRFRTFFEGSPDSIILAEIDSGRVIDANPAALKLLGRTHEEVVGMHQGELHPPELSGFASTSFHEHVQQVQFQDHTDPIETVILRKDGTRIPVEVIAKLIHLKGSPIIHGTFRDIVKRKEAEEERERLLTEIEEKQEELQRVIYVASHDLRSPLVNVRGFSEELGSAAGKIESLVRDRRLPAEIMDELEEIIREDLHESVKYIGTSITKMESLIGGLLRISRIGSVKIVPETIDMNHLLTEIRETFEFRLKDGPITLTIGDLPPCYGDPDQMNQVFSNLIDNSIKYLHPDRGGEIEISGRTDGKGVLYSVQDNGIGIPEEHLKSIFDIFHRVGEGGVNGEGLGLTAVKRILDRHGGRIRVESRQGEGSTFHIFMPGSSIVEGM